MNKWNKLDSKASNFLYSVSFMDKNNGLVTGEEGLLLSTKDGGKTWNKIPTGVWDNLFVVKYKNYNAIIAGDNGALLLFKGKKSNSTK
jgi:photosystem II stability/assembly factor-like uncharacterized protein